MMIVKVLLNILSFKTNHSFQFKERLDIKHGKNGHSSNRQETWTMDVSALIQTSGNRNFQEVSDIFSTHGP